MANGLSVGDVGNHAKGKRCAADQDLIGIDAIDVLTRDNGPLDLVIIAAATDEGDVVHAGKRIRYLRAVEKDAARSQVGMDANIEELLSELVPVFCNACAAEKSGLIVAGTGAARQGKAEERNATGSNDLLIYGCALLAS